MRRRVIDEEDVSLPPMRCVLIETFEKPAKVLQVRIGVDYALCERDVHTAVTANCEQKVQVLRKGGHCSFAGLVTPKIRVGAAVD